MLPHRGRKIIVANPYDAADRQCVKIKNNIQKSSSMILFRLAILELEYESYE
jgi:hypothetical protein